MKHKKHFFILLTVFITISAVALIYSNSQRNKVNASFQDPQYLIKARKNIIVIWYQEDDPNNVWEFTTNGTLICKNVNNRQKILTYKIVNTSPICGYEIEVDEEKETMYLITTEEDGTEECDDLRFPSGYPSDYQNKKICLTALGTTSIDAAIIFNKK
ncbi:MAG: hypothetical protein ACK54Y_01055 [Bacteroidota bacterium]